MSELTKCNFCALQRLIARYGADNVKLTGDDDLPGWVQVMVFTGNARNDRRFTAGWRKGGHAFLELTMACVC